jgi:hypothetical protein
VRSLQLLQQQLQHHAACGTAKSCRVVSQLLSVFRHSDSSRLLALDLLHVCNAAAIAQDELRCGFSVGVLFAAS